jgi:hypothetical protein
VLHFAHIFSGKVKTVYYLLIKKVTQFRLVWPFLSILDELYYIVVLSQINFKHRLTQNKAQGDLTIKTY